MTDRPQWSWKLFPMGFPIRIAGWCFGTCFFPWKVRNFHPSQVTFTPSFFRGVGGSTTNQIAIITQVSHWIDMFPPVWVKTGYIPFHPMVYHRFPIHSPLTIDIPLYLTNSHHYDLMALWLYTILLVMFPINLPTNGTCLNIYIYILVYPIQWPFKHMVTIKPLYIYTYIYIYIYMYMYIYIYIYIYIYVYVYIYIYIYIYTCIYGILTPSQSSLHCPYLRSSRCLPLSQLSCRLLRVGKLRRPPYEPLKPGGLVHLLRISRVIPRNGYYNWKIKIFII